MVLLLEVLFSIFLSVLTFKSVVVQFWCYISISRYFIIHLLIDYSLLEASKKSPPLDEAV